MLFTWDTEDLCIVFRWWHVSGPATLIISLLGVVALAAGYEAIRSGSRRYEQWVAKRQDEVPRMFCSFHTYTHTSCISTLEV
jgi:copper transporter 1